MDDGQDSAQSGWGTHCSLTLQHALPCSCPAAPFGASSSSPDEAAAVCYSGPQGAAAHGGAPLGFAGAAGAQAASERGLTLTSTRLGVSSTKTHREPRGPSRTTEPPGLSDQGESDSPGSCPAGSKAVGWLSGAPRRQGWTPGSRPPSSLGHRAGLAQVPSAG